MGIEYDTCDFNFGLHAVLCKRAETCKLESEAFLIYPALLPTLEGIYGEPRRCDTESELLVR